HHVLAGAVRRDQALADDPTLPAPRDRDPFTDVDAAGRRIHGSPQATTSAAAEVRTASPRSVLAARTIFPGSTCHMSVVMVSPGNTTPEKRTSNDLRRAGSFPQYAASTARPAWP